MSIFSDLFKGKEGEMKRISTLSPEQQRLMTELSSFTQGRIGKGLPAWEGGFGVDMSEAEQAGQNRLNKYVSGGRSDLTQLGLDTYSEGLKGMSPEATQDWYMKYIAPGERRYMDREVIPGIKESYVGSGTLHGSPSDRGITDAWNQYGTGQLNRIGEAIMSERKSARNLLPYLGEMGKIEGGIPQIDAAMRYGSLPRMLEREKLDKEIAEFRRTTPELNPILDLVMQMLGTTTQAAYYEPGRPSPFSSLVNSASKGFGEGLGNGMFSSPSTSTTDSSSDMPSGFGGESY